MYRRSGGHSYGSTIPGPIGSILEPARQAEQHASLPFACTLCGSCSDVCPVKIDLHRELLSWRADLVDRGLGPGPRRPAWRLVAGVLARPRLYALSGWAARWWLRHAPGWLAEALSFGWVGPRSSPRRALPEAPRRSFRARWAQREWERRRSTGAGRSDGEAS